MRTLAYSGERPTSADSGRSRDGVRTAGFDRGCAKRSRANKAQNCFLYCPSSDRSDSAIRLYIDEIEEDFLRSD